jgi:tetratricopeptide (TPR) repeat protein
MKNERKDALMTIFSKARIAGLLAAALAWGGIAQASDNPAMDAQVARINNEWARIKYQVQDKNQQYLQLDQLAKQAASVSARYPGRAEPLLWQGIVTSEEAAQASMFRQLGLATSARDILDKARSIDPHAANGGVSMSLGVLYYKVPGFPIGFGSAKKARTYLEAALAQDPNGLDANYFYGDFLNEQGDHARARAYLARALKAPKDVSRPVWDAGRRTEVRALLAKIDHALHA